MKPKQEPEGEYTEDFIARLQFKWGEGFLSPGGAEEVAAILEGVTVQGCEGLDIGCGLGAVDVLLVLEHGARKVVGIDIERPLLEHARKFAQNAGCSESIDFQLVEPGPLPFPDDSFDLVFSKDALIHVSDKNKLYADIHRVLRPNGVLVASDWYKASGPCAALVNFLSDDLGLSVELQTLDDVQSVLSAVGFEDNSVRDRHDWFRSLAEAELEGLKDSRHQEFVDAVGQDAAQSGIEMNERIVSVLNHGELRPGHLRATKK